MEVEAIKETRLVHSLDEKICHGIWFLVFSRANFETMGYKSFTESGVRLIINVEV